MSHRGVRDDIMACIERRQEAQVKGPIPMNIGNQEEEAEEDKSRTYYAPEFMQ